MTPLLPTFPLLAPIPSQCSRNMFAPMELDPLHKGKGILIDPTDTLRLTGVDRSNWQTVLGTMGVEVKRGSGNQAYFEARCVRSEDGHVWVGIASHDMNLDNGLLLGNHLGGFRWDGRGDIWSKLSGINRRFRLAALEFKAGDLLGVAVDCSGEPTVRFLVNGAEVYNMCVGEEGQGQVLFPAFSLFNAEIHINPYPLLR